MKHFLILFVIFNFLFTIDQIVETYDNGMPKIIRTYTQTGKNLVIKKEIGYYISGLKKYEKTYKNNQVSNMIGWEEDGKKDDTPSDFITIKSNKEKKINQIETENKVQNNKITYMKYKIDSLKVELSNYQIAFDEYRRENQQKLESISDDVAYAEERVSNVDRKARRDIMKIKKDIKMNANNNIDDVLRDIEYKLDRIKPKSFMTEKEYLKEVGSLKRNKGKLEWPVDGKIVGKFGKEINKELRTSTENPAIEIECAKGSPVMTVMDGIVGNITFIPGLGNSILINHGDDYTTIYSNMDDLIYVSEGQYVDNNFQIGTVGNDSNDNKGVLNFSIWYKGVAVNPENWLVKK